MKLGCPQGALLHTGWKKEHSCVSRAHSNPAALRRLRAKPSGFQHQAYTAVWLSQMASTNESNKISLFTSKTDAQKRKFHGTFLQTDAPENKIGDKNTFKQGGLEAKTFC